MHNWRWQMFTLVVCFIWLSTRGVNCVVFKLVQDTADLKMCQAHFSCEGEVTSTIRRDECKVSCPATTKTGERCIKCRAGQRGLAICEDNSACEPSDDLVRRNNASPASPETISAELVFFYKTFDNEDRRLCEQRCSSDVNRKTLLNSCDPVKCPAKVSVQEGVYLICRPHASRKNRAICSLSNVYESSEAYVLRPAAQDEQVSDSPKITSTATPLVTLNTTPLATVNTTSLVTLNTTSSNCNPSARINYLVPYLLIGMVILLTMFNVVHFAALLFSHLKQN